MVLWILGKENLFPPVGGICRMYSNARKSFVIKKKKNISFLNSKSRSPVKKMKKKISAERNGLLFEEDGAL